MSSTATMTGGRAVLHRVPYGWYVKLRDDHANDGVKLTYWSGTPEIVSPTLYEHERSSSRLDKVILAVTGERQIPCEATGSTTPRRVGKSIRKGHGKELDRSYYLDHASHVIGKRTIDLDAGDPPPDLWIEVDHRVSSGGRLPVYAAHGVIQSTWTKRLRAWVRSTFKPTHPF
jgi:Uma2 family endonuclease